MNLNTRECKTIAKNIFSKEAREKNLTGRLSALTFVEFYGSSNSLLKKTVLKKITNFLYGKLCGGIYKPENNEVIIFIDNIDKIEKINNSLFKLLLVCYHEIRHREQMENYEFSYDGFLVEMDFFLNNNRKMNYLLDHDNYFVELDANYYGILNAKKYMMDYYPLEYEKEKYNINLIEWRYLLDYKMYDMSKTIDFIINILKRKNESFNLKDISSILPIFLNEDGSFKNFNDIFENGLLYKLDKRIVYGFFASKSFWNNINICDIPKEYVNILLECLMYSYNFYSNQIKWINEKKVQFKAEYYQRILNTNNQFTRFIEISRYLINKTYRLIDNDIKSKKESLKLICSKIDLLNNYYNANNYK